MVSANDYYPFGSLEPYRTYSEPGSSAYRHGFNGKEQDNEVKGTGNQIDYGMRVYDPRLGRFLSVDPMQKKFGYYSPYQFAGNKPIMAKDLDGLEPQETITVGEEAIGKTALRVAWKEGNGKVVEMLARQATTKTVLVTVAERANVLLLIWELFTSPKSSPQTVAKDYPSFEAQGRQDQFWDIWIGPGRRFPLPPVDPDARNKWLRDYWPENLPITLPHPSTYPRTDSKPVGEGNDDDDDGYITLYRGGSNVANPHVIYTLAQDGIAYPKGLLPGHTAHEDEEAHTMNDNESIFTSWTSDKRTARHFASWGTAGLLFLRDLKNDPTTP